MNRISPRFAHSFLHHVVNPSQTYAPSTTPCKISPQVGDSDKLAVEKLLSADVHLSTPCKISSSSGAHLSTPCKILSSPGAALSTPCSKAIASWRQEKTCSGKAVAAWWQEKTRCSTRIVRWRQSKTRRGKAIANRREFIFRKEKTCVCCFLEKSLPLPLSERQPKA